MTTTQKTILLVEDEALISMHEARQLQSRGYAVVQAYNGEEAIAKVNAASPPIDLILMDINLGRGMDGTQAAQIILQAHEVPIVFLSSHAEPSVVAKTEQITAYGYVLKSSDITVLDASIKMAFKLYTAHQTIKRTNESLRLAQEASHAGMWDWDIIHNTLDWSPEFLKLFGMPPDTVAGFETWTAAVHPEDREGARQRIQEAMDAHTDLVNDYRIVLPTGEVRWIRATGKTYYADDRPLRMLGLCMDITERKCTEQLVAESQFYLQKAQEIGKIGHFSLDPASNIVEGSDELFRIFDVDRSHPLFEGFTNSVHPEDGHLILPYIDRAVKESIPYNVEHRVRHRDGTILYVHAKGEIISTINGRRMVGTVQDITDRKQVEKAQETDKARLRVLFDQAPIGITIFDTNSQIIDANDYLARLMGVSCESLLGVNILATVRDQRQKQALLEALEGNHSVFEGLYTFVTGQQTKHIRSLYSPLIGNDGAITGGICITEDISEREHTEEALRANEKLLREIAANYPSYLSIIESDLTIGFTSGLEFNKLGLDPQNFVGLTLEQVFGEQTPVVREHYLKVFGGSVAEFELFINNQYQRYRAIPLVNAEGVIERILAVVDNITERKQMEEALRKREAQLKTVMENTPDTILWVDREARINFINHPVPGLTESEVIGSSIYQWVPQEQHPILTRTFEAVFATGERGGYESLGPGPYGQTRVYDVQVMPVLIDGKTDSAIYTARDITDRKQAEETLRASEAQQRQLAEENARLLQEVNHRVGNNLALLLALVEWEMLEGASSPALSTALQELQRRIQSIARVHQLLSNAQWFPLDLAMLAEQVIEGALSLAPAREAIDCRIDSVGEPISVVPKQAFKLALLFNELTTNSLKYAFQTRGAGRLRVEIAAAGPQAQMTFSDDGPGWPADVLAGQRQHIGLSLVREIIEYEMQGTVALRNAGGAVMECRFVLESTRCVT